MILVTGGTGLVGSHLLLQLLQEGSAVAAIYRTESSLEAVKKVFSYYSTQHDILFNRVRWVQAELNDLMALEKAFEKVSLVYHCAAMISFDPADFKKLRKVNAEGTANIVNLCLAHKIKKLCHVSSVATIGAAPGKAASEDNYEPNSNANVYALSKYAAEMEVWRGTQEGLPVVIINPGVIMGPGSWNSGSGNFFTLAAGGMRHYPPGGTGFVGVKDVVSCMLLLMRSQICNERFILVERNMRFKEVLDFLSVEFRQPAPKIRLRNWQLGLLWRLDWVISQFLNRNRRLTRNSAISLKEFQRYSNQKIENALGFKFGSLDDDMAFSCEKYSMEREG
jgi:nucleoside-diphosphate-sugar epimerase